MNRYYALVFVVLLFPLLIEADEILLKNGKIYVNVNILEDKETDSTICIFTSMKKKIFLNKSEIKAIKLSEFDPLKKSGLMDKELTQDELIDFQRFEGNGYNPSSGSIKKIVIVISRTDSLLAALPKGRISGGGGYSYRRGDIPSGATPQIKDYISGLKNGFNITFDLSYYLFNAKNGLAIRYSRFASSNSMDNMYLRNTLSDVEDNISISFIGMGWTQRLISSNGKFLLISNLLAGMLFYSDDALVNHNAVLLRGSTFGMDISLGVDYLISKEFGIGFEVAFLGGQLNDMEINGQRVSLGDNKETLSHFNFNLCLQYYFPQGHDNKNAASGN